MIRLLLGLAILVAAAWFVTTKQAWLSDKLGEESDVVEVLSAPVTDFESTEPVKPAVVVKPLPKILTMTDRSISECRAALITVGEDILQPIDKPATFSDENSTEALRSVATDLEGLIKRDPLAPRYLKASKLLQDSLIAKGNALERYESSHTIGSPMDKAVVEGAESNPGQRGKQPAQKSNAANKPKSDSRAFFKQSAMSQWQSASAAYRKQISPLLRPN